MKKAIVLLPLSKEEKKGYEAVPGYEISFMTVDELKEKGFDGATLVIGKLVPEDLSSVPQGDTEDLYAGESFLEDPGVARVLNKPLILASASPRRRELLTKADIPFTVMPADIEEESSSDDPAKAAEEVSSYKAEYVADKLINTEKQDSFVILAADTVVSIDGKIIGKPKDEEEAFQVLKQLQGREHEVFTGVTIAVKHTGKNVHYRQFHEKTRVKIYPVSDEQIRDYITTGEPLDKAGSYGIQGAFAKYIKSIKGDYSNVVGLPVGRVFKELKQILRK